jgi:hypothetical protein
MNAKNCSSSSNEKNALPLVGWRAAPLYPRQNRLRFWTLCLFVSGVTGILPGQDRGELVRPDERAEMR